MINTAQYIVDAFFILWTLGQMRMLLVYLGNIPSALGIIGSPMLVFIAALAVIVNATRAALCFMAPCTTLLPALSATLIITPLAFAFAYMDVLGTRTAHAVYPELSMLTEKGRKDHALLVLRDTLLRMTIVCVVTGGLWYCFAR